VGVKGGGVESKDLSRDLLVLIIRSYFSCVDDGVPHDVWHQTDPETSHTLVGNDLFVAVH
jgi:hypothetical protein